MSDVDSDSMEATEPQVVGRYAIYGAIAAGGMASVHFGRQGGAAGFSRTVAIKRLHAHLARDPEFRTTMIDEARLAARIHHPNVVPTLDVVSASGELLVVMEYVRGESLTHLLREGNGRRRSVPLPIASAIVIGALHGLHAAHEATSDGGAPLKIVHRDVSPANILVGVDGVARVIDFGVAKAAGRLQMTSTGAIKGKLGYMAPEQLAGGDTRLAVGEVTRAADVYAVGALLWEILAGRRLFTGATDAQRAVQVLLGAKDPPSRYAPGLPPLLDALVMTALSLDPTDRFASAMDMAEALLRLVPPAFSTDVGKWVEEAAHEGLERRAAELARIESRSEATRAIAAVRHAVAPVSARGSPPSSSHRRAVAVTSGDDVSTLSSQPSSLSGVTPPSRPAVPLRPRRARAVGAFGGLLLIAAGIATFGEWRRLAADRAAITPVPIVASARAAVEPPATPSSPVDVRADAAPSASTSPPDAGIPVITPAPRSAPPVRTRPHAHTAPVPPRAAGPFRFAQPD